MEALYGHNRAKSLPFLHDMELANGFADGSIRSFNSFTLLPHGCASVPFEVSLLNDAAVVVKRRSHPRAHRKGSLDVAFSVQEPPTHSKSMLAFNGNSLPEEDGAYDSDDKQVPAVRVARGRFGDNKRCMSQIEPLSGAQNFTEPPSLPSESTGTLDRSVSQSTPSIDSVGVAQEETKKRESIAAGMEKSSSNKATKGLATWQMMSARPSPALINSTSSKSLRSSRIPEAETKKIKRSGSSFLSSLSSFRRPQKNKQAKPHLWVQASVSNSVRCEVCNKSLARSQSPARQCEKCEVFVHDHCKDHVSSCSKWNNKHPHDPTKGRSSFRASNLTEAGMGVEGVISPSASGKFTWASSEQRLSGELYSPLSPTFTPVTESLTEEEYFEAEEEFESSAHSLRPSRSFPSLNDPSWDYLDLWVPESESWSGTYKSMCKKLTSREVKRQDVIHELYRTEKHHCQTMVILKRTYREMLIKKKLLKPAELDALIPDVLDELLDFHMNFLRKLQERRQQSVEVTSVQDILIEHFGSEQAGRAVAAYVVFCSGKNKANQLYHDLNTRNEAFHGLMENIYGNAKYKDRKLLDCLLLITQRLTKYPVLVESIQKNTEKLSEDAAVVVKEFAAKVDQGVQREEIRLYWEHIVRALDHSVTTKLDDQTYTVTDLCKGRGVPRYICDVNWQRAVGKPSPVKLVIFSDIIVFLMSNGSKYSFFSQDRKSAVVGLSKLLVREKATKPRGIFLIDTTRSHPDLYDVTTARKSGHVELMANLKSAIIGAPPPKPGPSEARKEDEQLAQLTEELRSLFEDREKVEKKTEEYFTMTAQWYEEFCGRIEPLVRGAGKHFVDKALQLLNQEFDKAGSRRQAYFLESIQHTEAILRSSLRQGMESTAEAEDAQETDLRRATTFHGQKDLTASKSKTQPRRHTTVPPNMSDASRKISVPLKEEEEEETVGWDTSSRRAIVSVLKKLNTLQADNTMLRSKLTERTLELESWKNLSRHASEVQRELTLEQLRQSQAELSEAQRKFQLDKETLESRQAERERKLKEKEESLQEKENILQQQMANFSKVKTRYARLEELASEEDARVPKSPFPQPEGKMARNESVPAISSRSREQQKNSVDNSPKEKSVFILPVRANSKSPTSAARRPENDAKKLGLPLQLAAENSKKSSQKKKKK